MVMLERNSVEVVSGAWIESSESELASTNWIGFPSVCVLLYPPTVRSAWWIVLQGRSSHPHVCTSALFCGVSIVIGSSVDGGANRKCASRVIPLLLTLLLTWNGFKYSSFNSAESFGNVPYQ